jgi:hypothetical protein
MCPLKYCKFTFGFGNSTDTYKVVALHMHRGDRTITTAVQVLCFGNNVWRNIQSFPVLLCNLYYPDTGNFGGVHLNCTLNWLAGSTIIENDDIVFRQVIISLDLGTEAHTQLLPPPSALNGRNSLSNGVCVLMNSLCFYHDMIKGIDFVIWKMLGNRIINRDNTQRNFNKISHQWILVNEHDQGLDYYL